MESLSVLQAVGAITDDFVSDVLAVDKFNAHKLFDSIAKDPEKAAALAGMSSRQRIAEITRMSLGSQKTETSPAPAATPAKTVSKAPAPATRVVTAAATTLPKYSDKISDEEFTAQFNARMKERRASR
jgi:hypothetical protein